MCFYDFDNTTPWKGQLIKKCTNQTMIIACQNWQPIEINRVPPVYVESYVYNATTTCWINNIAHLKCECL